MRLAVVIVLTFPISALAQTPKLPSPNPFGKWQVLRQRLGDTRGKTASLFARYTTETDARAAAKQLFESQGFPATYTYEVEEIRANSSSEPGTLERRTAGSMPSTSKPKIQSKPLDFVDPGPLNGSSQPAQLEGQSAVLAISNDRGSYKLRFDFEKGGKLTVRDPDQQDKIVNSGVWTARYNVITFSTPSGVYVGSISSNRISGNVTFDQSDRYSFLGLLESTPKQVSQGSRTSPPSLPVTQTETLVGEWGDYRTNGKTGVRYFHRQFTINADGSAIGYGYFSTAGKGVASHSGNRLTVITNGDWGGFQGHPYMKWELNFDNDKLVGYRLYRQSTNDGVRSFPTGWSEPFPVTLQRK